MELGIFAKTFSRPTVEELLQAAASYGLASVQFNMACVGLPTLPEQVDEALLDRIAAAHKASGVRMAAVSGTFNMIDPDEAKRQDGLRRLDVLASACRRMGTSVITLCTGSRDPKNMWKRHVDNDLPSSWNEMIASMKVALQSAERHDITLAFEPESANVVDNARKGRRLLDEIGSNRLKVVLDPVNLVAADQTARMTEIIEEAFELLAPDVVIAHAKDLNPQGGEGSTALGKGYLDFDVYLRVLLSKLPKTPVIIHGVDEGQVAESVALLKTKAQALGKGVAG
jgi:sugar phosphate isomerase/epimerase